MSLTSISSVCRASICRPEAFGPSPNHDPHPTAGERGRIRINGESGPHGRYRPGNLALRPDEAVTMSTGDDRGKGPAGDDSTNDAIPAPHVSQSNICSHPVTSTNLPTLMSRPTTLRRYSTVESRSARKPTGNVRSALASSAECRESESQSGWAVTTSTLLMPVPGHPRLHDGPAHSITRSRAVEPLNNHRLTDIEGSRSETTRHRPRTARVCSADPHGNARRGPPGRYRSSHCAPRAGSRTGLRRSRRRRYRAPQ